MIVIAVILSDSFSQLFIFLMLRAQLSVQAFKKGSCNLLCYVTYNVTVLLKMINSFRHKGLEKFFLTGETKGIQAQHAKRLRLILGIVDALTSLDDFKQYPSLELHPLKGRMKGFWAIKVSGNWRVIFRWKSPDVYDVDYLDYH